MQYTIYRYSQKPNNGLLEQANHLDTIEIPGVSEDIIESLTEKLSEHLNEEITFEDCGEDWIVFEGSSGYFYVLEPKIE